MFSFNHHSFSIQTLMSSANDNPNYNTIERNPDDPVPEEPVQPVSHVRSEDTEEEPVEVQGTLGSIIMFLMRQSYIAALIIMMVSHIHMGIVWYMLWCSVVWYSMIYGVVRCDFVYDVVWCGVVYGVVLCVIWYGMWYSVVCGVILYMVWCGVVYGMVWVPVWERF